MRSAPGASFQPSRSSEGFERSSLNPHLWVLQRPQGRSRRTGTGSCPSPSLHPGYRDGRGGAECLRYRVKFKTYAELAKAGSLRSVTSDLGRRVLLGSMARCGPRFFTIVARVLEYRSAPESSVAHILNVSLCHFSASPRAGTDLRLRRSRRMGSIVLCSDECNRSSSS